MEAARKTTEQTMMEIAKILPFVGLITLPEIRDSAFFKRLSVTYGSRDPYSFTYVRGFIGDVICYASWLIQNDSDAMTPDHGYEHMGTKIQSFTVENDVAQIVLRKNHYRGD